MSAYGQAKRPKVREGRQDNVDYFQGIDKVEYNNMAPLSEVGYRYYSAGERVHSRAMEEWLKFSVCLTDFRGHGYDHDPPSRRPWDDGTSSLDNHKRCVKALFDFCAKLGVKHWCAFDSDLVPHADTWEETKQNWDEMIEYIQELSQRSHMKLMWLAPDLHSHPRYASGAFTSNEASTFALAATQIKRCLEAGQRLNAECVMLQPRARRPPLADAARELKLFAKMLKITAEYKDRLNYRCQLLLMPYCRSIRHEQYYMWDATSCLCLLSRHGLERHYRVCSPPHHACVASVYNMLGGVVIDDDVDQYDNRTLTLMMKSIVDQGAAPPGGVCLRLRPAARSPLARHVQRVDAAARALRVAAAVLADQTFAKHLQQRYSSYYSGFGSRLASADVSMEECEEYYKKNQSTYSESPARQENMDLMLQRFLDSTDHF